MTNQRIRRGDIVTIHSSLDDGVRGVVLRVSWAHGWADVRWWQPWSGAVWGKRQWNLRRLDRIGNQRFANYWPLRLDWNPVQSNWTPQ